MVDVGEDAPELRRAPRPGALPHRKRTPPARGPRPRRRKERGGRTAEFGPFLFVLAAVAPLGGAIFQILDQFGAGGLTATEAVGPRLQILGNTVNLVTGLLLVVAIVVASLVESAKVRLVAAVALMVAVLFFAVSVAVGVVAVVDEKLISRAQDLHVSVITYELASAIVAIGAGWLALQVLRRPVDA